MVVCGEQPARHLERPPTLMVEVLSDATRTTDLEVKRTIAVEHQVIQYLVIDPDQRTIRQASSSGWQTPARCESIPVRLDDRCMVFIDGSKLFDA
jgi:Uma2 family endonuclease